MDHPRRRFMDKVFDAIPAYITIQDRDLKIVEASQSFCRDFGDAEDRYCYQVYKQRPEKCENCTVERTFRDGQRHQSEEIVKTLDGRNVSVLVCTSPIYNGNGEVTHVVEMSTDITEQKELQTQYRNSRHRYHQLFEEVPCYISIQDRDLKIVEANRLFREAFGSNYGCKCYKVYKHRDEACYPCVVQQTFKDGETHFHEEVVTSKDNRRINVLVSTMPIKNANGDIESVIEMSTDITQIRQLQSKLTSIGMLISSISHGLKGLLNGLDGGFYLVNSGFKRNDQARVEQGWEIAQRNVERIRNMVLDILYYAKDREPDWQSLSATDLSDEVYDIMKTKANDLSIKLNRAVDDSIGQFEADHKAVRSLLVNLLENSLDACRVDKAKQTHEVSIHVHGDEDHVFFEISDNGIGMDQETREKAFSMFFSSKGTEGTGLGLFISNKIAQEHGGNIELQSEAGKGTRFIVKMPKKRLANSRLTSDTLLEEEEL
ncbi:MAG: PAS domain-containing protein [candidate division Zixibacteria bacterium]|nr:PAS domain-containing protein [candidate division Zixibacteria bacterium]